MAAAEMKEKGRKECSSSVRVDVIIPAFFPSYSDYKSTRGHPHPHLSTALPLRFVIRLAGNTIDALARASLLYAVQHLHSPLVVVLGHEKCGAVTAALQPPEALAEAPRDIKTLVKKIQSGIECALLEPGLEDVDDERLLCAIVCNVHSVARTLSEHPDIRPFIEQKALSVVGAYYAFNGVVSFFDDGEDGNATGKEVGSTVNGQASLCMSCSGTIHRSSSPTADPSQKVNSRLSVSEGLSKNT